MYHITMIPGDGIGPEVMAAARQVVEASGIDVQWDVVNAGADTFETTGALIPDAVIESIEKNKVALKGPITTPVGKGFKSVNVQLRKLFDLYANIRPIKKIKGIDTPFENVDLVIFRENTEGLYIGDETAINDNEVHAIKKVTKTGSERLIRKAFQYAQDHDIKKVTVAHKANILKKSDGLFLQVARDVANDFPNIGFEDLIIDNLSMQLVRNPSQFQLIATTNLYGDILSDLCAGLVGGLGVVPGANIGENIAIFESVHGSAPDIAGKGLANPTAAILSAAMMLDYLGEQSKSEEIIQAVELIICEGEKVTADLGGHATTDEMTSAIIEVLKSV